MNDIISPGALAEACEGGRMLVGGCGCGWVAEHNPSWGNGLYYSARVREHKSVGVVLGKMVEAVGE